jgi:hypothetical protein
MLDKLMPQLTKVFEGRADAGTRLKSAYGRLQTELVHQRSSIATAYLTEKSLDEHLRQSENVTLTWQTHEDVSKHANDAALLSQIIKTRTVHPCRSGRAAAERQSRLDVNSTR